jgi:hypothetical protein
MEARGVISMEVTVGSKSLSTAFFIVKVQGNCSVIRNRNWIHVNYCAPSTLHQFLIKSIDDEIKVVHTGTSTYIALVDAIVDWQHRNTQCLSGKDLTNYHFLSVSKDVFVSMSVQPAFEARLGNIVFQ